MRLHATLLSLPLLALCACDSGDSKPADEPAAPNDSPAPSGDAAQAKAPEAPKPEVKKGMPAKQVVAAWGHPDLELASTEGVGCFQYEVGPKKVVCFSLGTESATWPQVFGENYELNEIREPTPEDAQGAKAIKKPVNPVPDVAEPGH